MSWINNIRKKYQHKLESDQEKLEKLEKQAYAALDKGNGELAFLLGNTFNNVDDPRYKKNSPYDVCSFNLAKAKYWLEKAVECNHPDAMLIMGLVYCEGNEIVKKDNKYGVELLKKAKEIGTNPPHMADMAIKSLLVKKLNDVFF